MVDFPPERQAKCVLDYGCSGVSTMFWTYSISLSLSFSLSRALSLSLCLCIHHTSKLTRRHHARMPKEVSASLCIAVAGNEAKFAKSLLEYKVYPRFRV